MPDCAFLAYGSGGIHNSTDRFFVSGCIHIPDDGLFVSGAVRGRDERGCCRMRGVALQGRRECEAPRLGDVGERRDRLQAEPALGEGAGLVGEAVGGEREPFDRVRAGGDETGAGEGAEGRGHRGRGGEREGAGTGHHQDRDQHRNHPGRIVNQPPDGDSGREHEDAADEPRRGPIRELRDGRSLAGRLLGLAEHAAEHGGIPGARHFDLDHSGAVDAAGEHLASGRTRDRIRLSGEQRFVECGVSGADRAVGGDHLSGAYPHPVARAKRGGRYPFGLRGAGVVIAAVAIGVAPGLAATVGTPSDPGLGAGRGLAPGIATGSALAHPGGDERGGAGEGADCGGGPAAGEQFQVAGAAQQGDEHHHRVEPDFSLAGERREGASEEGDGEAERHRHVHRQAPAAERRGGAGEEGPPRPHQYRDREHHREPPEELLEAGLHAAVPVARVERDAEQHHLHPEQRRDAEPPNAGAALRLDGRLLRVCGVGGCAVSGLGEGFEEGVEAGGAGVELHLGTAEGEVDGGGGYPEDGGEQAFDEPGASGAAHAFYGEGDGGGVAAAVVGARMVVGIGAPTQQGRLHLGHAPCVELRPVAGVGSGCALGVGVGTQLVPGVESGVRDRLYGGAAGVAAYPYILARQHDSRGIEAEGRAAVVAAGWLSKFRGRKDFRVQGLRFVRVGLLALSSARSITVLR